MLKWLSRLRRPAHATVKDAQDIQPILAALPAADAGRSLEEIRFWIGYGRERADISAPAFLDMLRLLEAAGAAHARRLLRDYLGADNRQHPRESRVWLGLSNYHRDVADACQSLCESDELQAADLPWLHVAMVRHLNRSRKLRYFRYLLPDGRLWRQLGEAAQGMARLGIADAPVHMREGAPPVTPARELLAGLMLDVSMPWNLSPLRMEMAAQACRRLADRFAYGDISGDATCFVFDPLLGDGPWRMEAGMQPAYGALRFSPGPARDFLQERLADPGELLPALMAAVPGKVERADVMEALRHLDRQWAFEPLRRQAERMAGMASMSVVIGLEALVDALTAPAETPGGEMRDWRVHDRAEGGYGAMVPREDAARVEPGTVVGIRPAGGDGLEIGVVRRVARNADLDHIAGIQLLSVAAPAVTRIRRDSGLPAAFASALDPQDLTVICLAPARDGQPGRLLAPPGQLLPGYQYRIAGAAVGRTIQIGDAIEHGRDFDLLTWR